MATSNKTFIEPTPNDILLEPELYFSTPAGEQYLKVITSYIPYYYYDPKPQLSVRKNIQHMVLFTLQKRGFRFLNCTSTGNGGKLWHEANLEMVQSNIRRQFQDARFTSSRGQDMKVSQVPKPSESVYLAIKAKRYQQFIPSSTTKKQKSGDITKALTDVSETKVNATGDRAFLRKAVSVNKKIAGRRHHLRQTTAATTKNYEVAKRRQHASSGRVVSKLSKTNKTDEFGVNLPSPKRRLEVKNIYKAFNISFFQNMTSTKPQMPAGERIVAAPSQRPLQSHILPDYKCDKSSPFMIPLYSDIPLPSMGCINNISESNQENVKEEEVIQAINIWCQGPGLVK